MEELEIDCGAFGKIKRTSPPAQGDWAIKDGRLTLLGCIVRGLVTLSREELLPFLDAMDAQDACIQTLAERIVELDLEAMEKCRQLDTLRARVEKLEKVREAAQWREDTLDVIYENGRSEDAYKEGIASHANANRELAAALAGCAEVGRGEA